MILKRLRSYSILCCWAFAAATASSTAFAANWQQLGTKEEPITIAAVYAMSAIAPIVAWKNGNFAAHGVNIKNFVFTTSASDTIAALQSDSAQFIVMTPEAIQRANTKNLGFQSIAGLYPQFWSLLARSPSASLKSDPKSIRGKTISVTAPGSGSWAFAMGYVKSLGLDARDVQVVPLGGLSTTLAGLKAGRVDVAVTWEPGTSQAIADGYAEVLVDLQQRDQRTALYGADETLSQVLVTKKAVIQENPKLVKDIYRALDDAIVWIRKARVDEVAAIMASAGGVKATPAFVEGVKRGVELLPTSAALSRRAYDATSNFMLRMGLLDSIQPFDEFAACKVANCVE